MSRIIIVGGNIDLSRVMVRMFNGSGHDAEFIEAADDVLARLVEAIPNLLILNMESADPSPLIAILDGIREDERLSEVKTVILGAVRVSDAIGKVIAAGASGFVSWERTPPDEVVRALECWLPEGCR